MRSIPARQPPQNQGDPAGACTDSTESHAAVAFIFVIAATVAVAATATVVAAVVVASLLSLLPLPLPPPPPLPPPLPPPPPPPPPPLLLLLTRWFSTRGCFSKSSSSTRWRFCLMGAKQGQTSHWQIGRLPCHWHALGFLVAMRLRNACRRTGSSQQVQLSVCVAMQNAMKTTR